jgi:hypothetical protein
VGAIRGKLCPPPSDGHVFPEIDFKREIHYKCPK